MTATVTETHIGPAGSFETHRVPVRLADESARLRRLVEQLDPLRLFGVTRHVAGRPEPEVFLVQATSGHEAALLADEHKARLEGVPVPRRETL